MYFWNRSMWNEPLNWLQNSYWLDSDKSVDIILLQPLNHLSKKVSWNNCWEVGISISPKCKLSFFKRTILFCHLKIPFWKSHQETIKWLHNWFILNTAKHSAIIHICIFTAFYFRVSWFFRKCISTSHSSFQKSFLEQ